MRAMVLKEIGRIESSPLQLQERPIPIPGDRDLQVQIHYSAICRTDLHVIEGELPKQKSPLVPGHQAVGIVTAVGQRCEKFQVGDRVGIAWLRKTCGDCEFCRSQRENLCVRPQFTGYHEDGVFADYACVPEDFAYSIPTSLTDLQAVPLLCAGIIGFRALKRSELPKGGSLAIFGFGSSAHVTMQVARWQGAEISVVSKAERHRQLAAEMGVDFVAETVEGLPHTVDSAILFAPAGDLVPPALTLLKPGGTLVTAGIHMSDIPSLNYEKHLFHEKNLRSVTANTREDGRELLAEATRIEIEPRTRIYALKDLNLALQDLKADRIAGTGVIDMSL